MGDGVQNGLPYPTYVEIDKSHALLLYNMSSPEDANYNCRECSSKFKSIEELDEHMREVHNLRVSNE